MNKLVVPGLLAALLLACSSSAPDAGAGACPVGEPSTQTVTFHVKTGTAGSFLVTRGSYCEPYSIAQGGTKLTLSGSFTCFCECAGIPKSAVSGGTTGDTTLTWNATSLTYCDEAKDCGGLSPGRTSTVRHDLPVRAHAGHYVATFRLDSAPPADCTASNTDPMTFNCMSTGMAPSYGIPPSGGEVCPASQTVDVEFNLPASGNVDVDVQLP